MSPRHGITVFCYTGDVETAQSCFSNAYKLRNKDSESDKLDNLLDLALLSMAQNDYESALTTLKKANETQPGTVHLEKLYNMIRVSF